MPERSCRKPLCSMNTAEICEKLRPPPFPPEDFPAYKEIVELAKNNQIYTNYTSLCNITLPNINTSKSTTETSTETSTRSLVILNSTLQPTITNTVTTWKTKSSVTSWKTNNSVSSTPSLDVTTVAPPRDTAATASTAILVVVILLILAAVGIGIFFWYKKKKRNCGSVNTNSLPLKRYEDTNYLDNKAHAGQCWTPTSNNQSEVGNSANKYGSFPPLNGNDKIKDILNNETTVEYEQQVIERGSGIEIVEAVGYVNENFDQKNEDESRSPGVDSQTPFIDMIDGGLPNAVLANGTEINVLKSNMEEAIEEDSGNVDSQSSQNQTVERRPQKKKRYLSKSAHEEKIPKDLEANRKTV